LIQAVARWGELATIACRERAFIVLSLSVARTLAGGHLPVRFAGCAIEPLEIGD